MNIRGIKVKIFNLYYKWIFWIRFIKKEKNIFFCVVFYNFFLIWVFFNYYNSIFFGERYLEKLVLFWVILSLICSYLFSVTYFCYFIVNFGILWYFVYKVKVSFFNVSFCFYFFVYNIVDVLYRFICWFIGDLDKGILL